ncbi:MAG TPA: methyltransferase domain-containing protein [Steroidobacteraceae bacterium]|jgi:SAM-dependent methyltransferase|nr:methyltransferase domain-containing protein [Steroidobacteraceae bacterium]
MPDIGRLADVLCRCAAGVLPARVAAMHLLMQAESPEEAYRALLRARKTSNGGAGGGRLREVESLLAGQPQAWAVVHGIINKVQHRTPAGDSGHWAALFDDAARISPEASVALYSLGSPRLLAAATLEVVSVLSQWGLVGRGRTVLDIGCGIGRLEAALSPLSAAVIGIDISPGMIALARTRCAACPNVRLLLGSGQDLAGIADDSVDLTVLVDTFPYLLLSQGRIAQRYLTEIARVARTGGDVVILNFSYRGDVAADRRELERLAAPQGLALARTAERPCASWDAPAFHLIKRGSCPDGGNETRITMLPTGGED